MLRRLLLAATLALSAWLVSDDTLAELPKVQAPSLPVPIRPRPYPVEAITAPRIVSISPPASIANTWGSFEVELANAPGGLLWIAIVTESGVVANSIYINRVVDGRRPATFPAMPAGRYSLWLYADGQRVSRVGRPYEVLGPPPPETLPTRTVTLNLRVDVPCDIDMTAPYPQAAQFTMDRFITYRDSLGKFERTAKSVRFAFVRSEQSPTSLRLFYRATLPMARGRYVLNAAGPDFTENHWFIEQCTTRSRTGVTTGSFRDVLVIKALSELTVPDGKDPVEVTVPGTIFLTPNIEMSQGPPPTSVRPSEP